MSLIFAFDLDGTLLASMPYKARPFARAMAKLGIDYSHAYRVFMENAGVPLHETVEALLGDRIQALGKEQRKDLFDRIKQEFVSDADLKKVRLRPGARRTLENLRREGAAIVVSSSSPTWKVREMLKQKRVRHLVDGVLGYSFKNPQFMKGAIHNEMARRIAAKHGMRSGKLVYVGDAPFDMKRTRETPGAIAVGITGTVSEDRLRQSGAHHVVNRLEELLPLARRL